MNRGITDNILANLNYLNDSKKTGNNVNGIVTEIVEEASEVFARGVAKGRFSDDEIESFKTQIPGDWAYQGMDDVRKKAIEAIDVSLMMWDAHKSSMETQVKHM